MLAEFASSLEAVRCSIDIQHKLGEFNTRLPENRRMLVRIGINFGDVVVRDDNLYGDSVNFAARMESIAPPGGIAVSSDIYRRSIGRSTASSRTSANGWSRISLSQSTCITSSIPRRSMSSTSG